MAPHYGSSGAPYPPSGDLGPFAPSGEPKSVQRMSGASSEGTEPDDGDAALGELGAGIKKKTKSSSLAKDGERATIPTDTDGLLSLYNRKG